MPSPAIHEHLAAFRALHTDLFQKDFLLTWEHPSEEIQAILTLAETLKRLHQEGFSYRAFDTGLAISIFRDNSTRTRFSYASAASAMGFTLSELDEQKSQVAHGETVRETANMISVLPRDGSVLWLSAAAASPERIIRTPTKPSRPKATQ